MTQETETSPRGPGGILREAKSTTGKFGYLGGIEIDGVWHDGFLMPTGAPEDSNAPRYRFFMVERNDRSGTAIAVPMFLQTGDDGHQYLSGQTAFGGVEYWVNGNVLPDQPDKGPAIGINLKVRNPAPQQQSFQPDNTGSPL